jgi:geranylgeranylglycerol-phosphate geranylgeranyltransferase
MDFGAYFKVIRPSACIIIAASALIGQILALGHFPDARIAVISGLSCFLLTASSFTLNDYVDYEVDLINTPQRPIPSGRIKRIEALRYGISLGIVGSAVTLFLNPIATIVGFSLYILTILYTIKVKVYGFIGNIIVALSIASYFLFGYLTVNSYLDTFIVYIASICFFYSLGGEVAQSIADAEGDRLRGVKSIALKNGPMTAAIVTSICYALMAFVGAYTALLFNLSDNRFTSLIVVGTILVVGIISVPLLRNPGIESAIRARKIVDAFAIIILSGIFVFLVI